jgi:DNA-directed RNA polymerase specialized sigma24 family protein
VEELEKYLRALLALQLRTLTDLEKPELLLHGCGFTSTEIADLLGKKEPAVRKAISRAKNPNKGGSRR